MCGTESPQALDLVSTGPGCSCCSSETTDPAAATGDAEYSLEGLTCGHCVETVRTAVTAVNGVETASIVLIPGARSRLVISGSAPDAAIREAVTSAGYSVIPS
ncbi:heavy-metal-associated domain-containing protein [Paenarthrobacter nicotinovorans]|uniref:heavy-metal-associated domain-containing protein n=1 Tax=Paenarthrobacter nicotinovorans TaxID=29320 RepID=UPI003D425039